MNWFYALNNTQQGPVTDAQLDELIRSGVIRGDTPVWRDGLPDWQPLNIARPTVATAAGLPPVIGPGTRAQQNTCVECGLAYAPSDLITLNNQFVCATCKPRFLQRMAEGGAAPGPAGLVWKSGREGVVGNNSPFPDRCVRCNSPANGYRLKRELSWHPPAYLLLVFIGLLIYLIVAMIVRKKATLHIGLCEVHRAQRKRDILIASLTAILGLVMVILSAVMENGWLAMIGAIMLIGGGIYGGVRAPIISVVKIENNIVRFKGAGRSFLDSLPEWTGPK